MNNDTKLCYLLGKGKAPQLVDEDNTSEGGSLEDDTSDDERDFDPSFMPLDTNDSLFRD